MKMTHLTICLEKKVSISSKFNYRLIVMFTLPVDLTYVRSAGFLFPLSKIGISYKVKKVCALAHTRAERGRVSDNFAARECA